MRKVRIFKAWKLCPDEKSRMEHLLWQVKMEKTQVKKYLKEVLASGMKTRTSF